MKKLGQHRFIVSPKQQKQSESDLQKITAYLNNLTSGHRYEQAEDFIKAMEANKLRINLKYNSGQISGYTIKMGNRKYHDSEINNGSYSINALSVKGVFKQTLEFTYLKRSFTINDIMKNTSDEMNKKHINSKIIKFSYRTSIFKLYVNILYCYS